MQGRRESPLAYGGLQLRIVPGVDGYARTVFLTSAAKRLYQFARLSSSVVNMEEEAKRAFRDLRSSVSHLLERAATYSATDPLDAYVKAVTSALASVSEVVKHAHVPIPEETALREEVEKLSAELEVQKQLLALCGLDPTQG